MQARGLVRCGVFVRVRRSRGRGHEGAIQSLELLGAELRAQVAIGGCEL